MNMKLVGAWPRALSGSELEIITSWNRLADRVPQDGQECDFYFIANLFSDGPHTGTYCGILHIIDGKEHRQPGGGFKTSDHGVFVSSPKYTFWKPKQIMIGLSQSGNDKPNIRKSVGGKG